jgi:NDP-sugar pyrophosphorylase family protein
VYSLVILAGGLATRLRPVTETIPKALIEINGRPFIEWQLEYLSKQNIKNIVISIGYLGEMIKEVVSAGNSFGLNIQFSFDGDELLGTGGAVKKAIPLLSDDFFIMYGDSYLPINFAEVSDFYESAKTVALMTILKNEGKWDLSNVSKVNDFEIYYDKKNRNKTMQYIDYGLSLVNKSIFNQYKNYPKFDLAELFTQLSINSKLSGYEVKERFYEIGSFNGMKEISEYLSQRID